MSGRKRKPALGNGNPFGGAVDAILGPSAGPPAAPKPSGSRKVRVSFSLPLDLVERARNAAWWKAGPPDGLTLSAIVEAGLRRELGRLEKKNGGPFKAREGHLRPGRR